MRVKGYYAGILCIEKQGPAMKAIIATRKHEATFITFKLLTTEAIRNII